MLQSEIRKEWRLSNVCYTDEPTFISSEKNDASKAFSIAEKLPFSVASIVNAPNNKPKKFGLEGLNVNSCTNLSKITFCLPSASTAFFHKQQRDRKIWWRKFSAQPGRFKMTEINYVNNNQSVEIQAEFPWGIETIETVQCLTDSPEAEAFSIKDGRKVTNPHIVTSLCSLEMATLTYLCDAYDPINEDTTREMMRFHRKLTPIKVAFAATASTASVAKELSDLSLVLARKIRKLGIPCLLLPDLAKKSLEVQFLRNDEIGIPYTIVCNDRTLQDGIIGFRSRDTTLKEQSHVGIVVNYVQDLMRNY